MVEHATKDPWREEKHTTTSQMALTSKLGKYHCKWIFY